MTEKRLPSSSFARGLAVGKLVTGLAGGALSESVKRLRHGQPITAQGVWLTPSNARKLAQQLSQMRGAAMKVGQLLSMEAGEFLPPEIAAILDSLREDAHITPLGEIGKVLESQWGADWTERFSQFTFTPIASGSIGQVHTASARSGEKLAIKIQHPGVRQSIDSDIDHIGRLLKIPGLVPPHIELKPLLEEARRQLHEETDYAREAQHLLNYRSKIAYLEGFEVPQIIAAWSTGQVLCMHFLEGKPIESVIELTQEKRNDIATRLVTLMLHEALDWGLVQTDPNFGNYRYNASEDQIQLLDFGATREYSDKFILAFRDLVRAALAEDRAVITSAAHTVGYLSEDDSDDYRRIVTDLIWMATEPLRKPGPYDFANTTLASRVANLTLAMRAKQQYGSLPPPDILFLHRKIGGLYLLLRRLKSKVAVHELARQILEEPAA